MVIVFFINPLILVDFSSFVPFLNNFGIGRVVANAVYRKDAHVFGAELAINGNFKLTYNVIRSK
jgi:hypothetical protein